MNPRLTVARAVVELTSPMAIRTGTDDDVLDAPVVVDADGLPALPGSSVAGALIALARQANPTEADRWFGPEGASEAANTSPLWVSWGRLHDARDTPVAPEVHGGHHDDEVLQFLRGTVIRDHVRLNDAGVVDRRGKFDRAFVPAGARFTLELRLTPGDGRTPSMDAVLGWLSGASLGGATGSGFGQVRLVRAHRSTFNLSVPADASRFRQLPPELWLPVPQGVGLAEWQPPTESTTTGRRLFRLSLQPETTLLIGSQAPSASGANLTWFSEQRIVWEPAGPSIHDRPVLPGSALRGALRHRTLFHLRVLAMSHPELDPLDVLRSLFGADPHMDQPDPHRGAIRVEECPLPDGEVLRQTHVAIDRFTQGPRDGMLFTEEALWLRDKALTVSVSVESRGESELGLQALRRALQDLCEGTLGLGHGASRGHGFFTGTFHEEAA